MLRSARSILLATAVATAALLGACGDDGEAADDTTAATSAYEVVPMPEAVEGLDAVVAHGVAAAEAAAAGDYEDAAAEVEALRARWLEFEGTIKTNDRDLYEALETAQALIADGVETENADRVAEGAQDQGAAADSFVAAYG